jgi:hypothetical protein
VNPLLLAALLSAAPPVRPVAPARPAAAGAATPARAAHQKPPRLADALLAALAEARLDELYDAGPSEGRCPGDPFCPWPLRPAAAAPHLDLAVIRLDARGRALEVANVVVDPATPQGREVKLDRNFRSTDVHFRRWSQDRREAGTANGHFTPADDVAPTRRVGADFMVPYPASLFKVLVAFHVERRAAQGALSLTRQVFDMPGLPPPGEPPVAPEQHTLAAWVERMITESDNRATRAVLRHLHDRGEVERLNRDLATLGLETLRIDGTMADGGRWVPGEISLTAMDLARLLWLTAGGQGTLWRTQAGLAVTRQALPEIARERLQFLLADQGFHDLLSAGSRCGTGPAGIPAQVPLRFIDPATGFAVAGDQAWKRDVRPCNEAAEVRFLHKTGLTWNFASDGGLVEALPGKPFRRYVVVMISSAGTRYVDPEDAAAPRHPCEALKVCASRKLAILGAAIDAHAVKAAAWERKQR